MAEFFFLNIKEENYTVGEASLSVQRAEKAAKCKKLEKRRQSVAASVLLESKLEELYGIKRGSAVYTENEHGKPALALEEHSDIKFNLSHSKDAVMLAIGRDYDLLGCDIEEIREIDFAIAKRFFTQNEYNCIVGKLEESEEEARRLFFRLWTLKESFVKAVGCGLSLGPGEFEIYFDSSDNPCVSQNVSDARFEFVEFSDEEAIKGYAAAAAVGKY